MDLTIQQLRYFVATAEHLHFTRAAEQLHISPPSLSQQIAGLERRLGATLFLRTSRRVELIEAGAEFLALARRAVAAMDEVVAYGQRLHDSGEAIRLGLTFGNRITSAILAAAAAEMPDVRWQVRRLGFAEAADAVRSGTVDVAIAPCLRSSRERGVRVVPLWRERRVLVVATSHPLAGKESVAIDVTNGERFVSSGDEEPVLAEWFVVPRPDGTVPRVDRLITTFEEVLDLCEAGLGVNIAGSTAAAGHARPGLAFVPIDDLPEIVVSLLVAPSQRRAVAEFERIATSTAAATAPGCGGRAPEPESDA